MDKPVRARTPIDTTEFSDGLAASYHLVHGDHWDEAVARQAEQAGYHRPVTTARRPWVG